MSLRPDARRGCASAQAPHLGTRATVADTTVEIEAGPAFEPASRAAADRVGGGAAARARGAAVPGRAAAAIALALFALALLLLACAPVFAGQEVVLRLAGSDFEIGGELRSYDGRRYVVAAPGFGELSLDSARYACVSGACGAAAADARGGSGAQQPTLELAPLAGPAPARIVLDGAPALTSDLLPALVRGYARHLGGTAKQRVGIDAGTTGFQIADARGRLLADVEINRREPAAALSALASGSTTLAATARAVTPADLAALPSALDRSALAAHETVLGLDGVAIVVPPGSPAVSLPAASVARILAGEVRNWSEVGLPAGPIQVYAGPEGTPPALAALLGRPKGLALAATANRIGDAAALSDAVARDPAGIGIASLSQLRNARALDIVLGCGLTARATDFAVKTEEYPLVRRLHLYSKGQPGEPLAQEFVRFAVSADAQPAIRDGGAVDQSIVAASDADERRRLAETQTRGQPAVRELARRLAADVGAAHRLSTTLRFQINSADLDAKARGDVQRLARLLAEPAMRGKSLVLAGFTDTSGAPDVNARLSLKRAEEVRQALLDTMAAGGIAGGGAGNALPVIEARGYGPAAPVACNGADAGQHRNRRVEVWLRDEGAPALAAAPAPRLATAAGAAPQGRKTGKRSARTAHAGQKLRVR